MAALWADGHDPQLLELPKARSRCYGGEGTPAVSEFAATELGALLETSTNAAGAMIGDALDLRHRLPETWDRVLAGTIRAWKARKVAAAIGTCPAKPRCASTPQSHRTSPPCRGRAAPRLEATRRHRRQIIEAAQAA